MASIEMSLANPCPSRIAFAWQRTPLAAFALVALWVSVVSCSSSQSPPTLVVSVAASTSDAVERLADQFHAQTGVGVKVNPGPSNGLATQILAGAPADLFLSASREWADKIDDAGHAAARVDLLTNRLVVVVPRGNPAGVKQPDDLSSATVKKLALAGENVPAGMYADQAIAKLGQLQPLLDAGRIVRGQDVRAVLGYVDRGEAEAGVVYASDALAATGVETACEFDPALHDRIVYVLVLLKHENESPNAREFYEFMQTPDAQQVFSKLGFVPLTANNVK